MTFENLQKLTLEWAKDKDLLHEENADKQFMKFIEEVFEFKTEMDIIDLLGENELAYNDMEFGFGQARIDRYTRKVNSLLDSVNLDYLSFEDLLEEMSLKPTHILRLDDKARNKINKRLSKGA